MLKRILILAGLATIAIALESSGWTGDDTELKVYRSPNGNDIYNLVGVYPVSFETALKDFAAAGGAPVKNQPGEQVLNFQDVPGVSLDGPQSWDGFVAFLENRYGKAKAQPMATRCDATVQIDPSSLAYSCTGLPCPPSTDKCVGWFAWANINYICLNIPKCPKSAPLCKKVYAKLPLSSFTSSKNPVCRCGFTNACEKHPDPGTISGFMHQVAACKCGSNIPSLSVYGLAVLIAVLGATALLVFRRRRAELAR